MAVNEDVSAYAVVAASNTPSGSTNVGPDLDDHLRDIKRNIRRVAERFQGPTAPEAFRGREWLDTSSTATAKVELKLYDGSNEVSLFDIDTSAGTARPYLAGTVMPSDSLALQSKESISGSAVSITTLTASGDITGLGDVYANPATGSGVYLSYGYGAEAGLTIASAQGTKASKTAATTATSIGRISAQGWDGAAYYEAATITFTPTQTFTGTSGGSKIAFSTTPNNSQTLTTALTLNQNQSATFAAGVTIAGAVVNTIQTLANDATPSVSGGRTFLTGGTTTITDFDDGVTGQEIIILAEHAITITDGTNIFLNGSANFVMASSDSLHLIQKADGFWYEIGRSVN